MSAPCVCGLHPGHEHRSRYSFYDLLALRVAREPTPEPTSRAAGMASALMNSTIRRFLPLT